MSSTPRPELLDLERDLPTTAADVAALRRARAAAPRHALAQVLEELSRASRLLAGAPRRSIFGGRARFEL